MSLYNLERARSDEQREKMRSLEERGICVFCAEHIHESDEKILFETEQWLVKPNDYPYKGAKLHLLIIPKDHVATLSQLSPEARADFFPVIERCEEDFDLESYAIGVRSGDMRRNGGTIEHLHAHLVVGDVEDPDHEPVRFKMSSRPGPS